MEKKIFAISILIFIIICGKANSQNFDIEDFKKLGASYKEQKLYFLSYVNNLNYYNLSNDSNSRLEAGLDALSSCLFCNRYQESNLLINQMKIDYPLLQNDLNYYNGYLLVKNKFFEHADSCLNLVEQDLRCKNQTLYLKAYSYLYNNQINSCSETLGKIDSSFEYFNQTNFIKSNLSPESFKYKRKSKSLAFALSAIVPGSGQVYTGYLFDASYAFGFNLITGIATYSSWKYELNKEKSDRNYILPICSSLFFTICYISNLYNSVNLVNKSNYYYQNQHYMNLLKKFEVAIDDKHIFLGLRLNLPAK